MAVADGVASLRGARGPAIGCETIDPPPAESSGPGEFVSQAPARRCARQGPRGRSRSIEAIFALGKPEPRGLRCLTIASEEERRGRRLSLRGLGALFFLEKGS